MGVRRVRVLAITLGIILAGAGSACAQTLDEAKAKRVKAAYLYNFAKFAVWPEGVFPSDDTPIVFGVVGDGRMAEALEKMVKGKTVHHRPIVVRHITSISPSAAAELRSCQLLFVCACERDRITLLWDLLDHKPVLVVSDIQNFARRGGMIGLQLEHGRIVFTIHRSAVDRVGIRLSAKLLKLAKIVG